MRGKFRHKSYPIGSWWAVVVRTLSSYLHFQLKKSCSLFPGKASGQFGKLDDRSKRGQKHATYRACKWLAWFLGTWTPFRLASGFACGKRFSLKQRLIPDPFERKWAVAASFHNRFNELLCPGGGRVGKGWNDSLPEPLLYITIQLPLRIMGVWGGEDWEFKSRVFCSFICSAAPPEEQWAPFWLISYWNRRICDNIKEANSF